MFRGLRTPDLFRLLLAVLLLVGLSVRPWPTQAAAPLSLDELVDALQQKYRALAGFSADFQQIYSSVVNSVRQEESGVLYMKKPGRMRWEYQKPETKLFVSDGQRTYFYVPADRQVTTRSYTTEDIQSVPVLFLLGQGDIRREFNVSWEIGERKRRRDNYFIHLRPKTPNSPFSAVLVEIHPADFTIERLVVIDPIADRSEFVLSRFTPTAKLNDDLFKFKIPKGVEVLNANVR